MKPPISSADLLRAFRALKPSGENEKRAIAATLGFTLNDSLGSGVDASEKGLAPIADTPPPSADVQPAVTPPPDFEPSHKASELWGGFTVSGPQRSEAEKVTWSTSTDDFELSSTSAEPIRVAPLFFPRWTRAILSTALSVRGRFGALDIVELTREIACGRPIRKYPRMQMPKIAARVEVLVDVGDTMLPFIQDQRDLVSAVQAVVGIDSVKVLKFTGTPGRGAGTDEMDVWPDYSFPPPGTHVLLLSDLGIGRPPMCDTVAGLEEWRGFALALRRRGIACTAFVPYALHRWPITMTRLLRIVEWDRATTAGNIRFSGWRKIE